MTCKSHGVLQNPQDHSYPWYITYKIIITIAIIQYFFKKEIGGRGEGCLLLVLTKLNTYNRGLLLLLHLLLLLLLLLLPCCVHHCSCSCCCHHFYCCSWSCCCTCHHYCCCCCSQSCWWCGCHCSCTCFAILTVLTVVAKVVVAAAACTPALPFAGPWFVSVCFTSTCKSIVSSLILYFMLTFVVIYPQIPGKHKNS